VNRDALYLRHVLDSLEKIERYALVGHAEFMAASHWQDAVIRQLEIIGEAVKRVTTNHGSGAAGFSLVPIAPRWRLFSARSHTLLDGASLRCPPA
jgi:Protein of unknown function DUF86